jgi:hypothetical protein
MAKHITDKVWDLRKDGDSNGYVMTVNDKSIYVYYYSDMNDPSKIVDFEINRSDARLLARRILECLDESK